MEDSVYPYGKELQQRILALFIQDPEVSRKYFGTIIEPKFFEWDIHRAIAENAMYITQEMNSGLSAAVLIDEVVTKTKNKDQVWITEASKEIHTIFDVKLPDRRILEDKVLNFAKYAAMRDAILSSAPLISTPEKYTLVLEKIKNALKVGQALQQLGHDLFNDYEARAQYRYDRMHLKNVVPTGFPSLDTLMLGGLSAGELGIILAPSNRGKSIVLVNIGAAALLARKNVMHIILEHGEMPTGTRYDMRIAGLTKGDLFNEYVDEAVEAKLKKHLTLNAQLGGSVKIYYFGRNTMTPQMLRNHMDFVESIDNFKPDLLIVDYGDLLKPPKSYDSKRFELSDIYAELVNIAKERNIPTWSASQTNRDAFNKEEIRMEDMGEDIGKVQIADVIIGVCQTEEEERNSKMRLCIAKMRDFEGKGKIIHCNSKKEKMRVSEIV